MEPDDRFCTGARSIVDLLCSCLEKTPGQHASPDPSRIGNTNQRVVLPGPADCVRKFEVTKILYIGHPGKVLGLLGRKSCEAGSAGPRGRVDGSAQLDARALGHRDPGFTRPDLRVRTRCYCISLKTQKEQDRRVRGNRDAINAKLLCRIAPLDRGNGTPEDEPDTYLAEQKAKSESVRRDILEPDSGIGF